MIGRILIILGYVLLIPLTIPTQASSRHWIQYGGSRPYIDVMEDKANGGVPRNSIFYVYATAGEEINLGSSALGIGQGDILYTDPTGDTKSCLSQRGGRINDLAQEQFGPLSGTDGYVPCLANVTNATAGIWQVKFVSPEPGGVADDGATIASGGNPAPNPVGDNWFQGDDWGSISAWDITVQDDQGDEISGRTYAKYLSLNTGSFEVPLNLQTIVRTREGFTYNVDLNGMRPFGFAYFSNSNGYTDDNEVPLYRSLNLEGPNTNTVLPAGSNLHLPSNPDTATQFTHKIFFETPDPNLPVDAPSADGVDWLNPPVPATPTISNFQFTGEEGTPFKAGTNPLGGTFEFTTNYVGNFAVIIDLNQDGIYGNGNDKTIGGLSNGTSASTAYWDGTDVFGVPVVAGNVGFNAQVEVYLGEVHFPFFDVEHVPNGLKITRLTPVNPTATQNDIHWDDRLLEPNTEPSCVTGGTPVATEPNVALVGASSEDGARGYDNNYGNCKALDTWSRVETDLDITSTIELRESDLQIEYLIAEPTFYPGQTLQYSVRVTNNGPTDKTNALLSGLLPVEFTNVSATCDDCTSFTHTQSDYAATYDLPVGGSLTINFTALVDPQTQAVTITQDNAVTRAADYTDPRGDNNAAQLVLTATNPPAEDSEPVTEGQAEVVNNPVPDKLIRTGGF